MKVGKTLVQLAQELERQMSTKKDYVVQSQVMKMDLVENKPVLEFGKNKLGITKTAHSQLATRLKIPQTYYDRMRQESPELLKHNVNTWLGKSDDRRMVRTLDGDVRALLSDRYRPIDNYDLIDSVLPKIRDAGCEPVSCELTESHMYLKVISPKIQGEIRKGDVVQAGLVLTNSEIGAGSVRVEPLIYRLVCSNGMIATDSSLRKYHVGRALDGDFDLFQRSTLAADNKAFFMKVHDIVNAVLTMSTFQLIYQKMVEASKNEIKAEPEQLIENVTDKWNLSDDDGSSILKYLVKGGDYTQYGLVNAATRASQDMDSYEQATAFERLGGEILELENDSWKKIAGK